MPQFSESKSCRTTKSPRPRPSRARLVVTKGSKMDSSTLSSTPRPLSKTRTTGASTTIVNDPSDRFLIAWQDMSGVFARRYNADGSAVGSEFQVSSSVTIQFRESPEVAAGPTRTATGVGSPMKSASRTSW